MKKREILKHAVINSFCTALYVIFIVLFIYLLSLIFPNGEIILIPIAMLMLFVFSAAFTGSLVFLKPMMWYLDGKKKEAVSLLVYTLGIFLILTIIAFLLLILFI